MWAWTVSGGWWRAVLAGWFVLLPGFVAGAVAAAERRVALVIGNGAYAGAERLDTPRQDAADVSAALGKLGFTLIAPAPRDLDQRGMEQMVKQSPTPAAMPTSLFSTMPATASGAAATTG